MRRRCLAEARRYARHDHEAEDIVQEAMLRAWRARTSCAGKETPLSWMLAITRNEGLRVAGRPATPLLDGAAEPSDQAAADELQAVLSRVDVSAVLSELKDDDRLLLSYRYVADMTQPAISERLGVPEGTIKVRLHRLRQRLRDRLHAQ